MNSVYKIKVHFYNWLIILFAAMLFSSCGDKAIEPVYGEGLIIPGTEFTTGRQDFGADWQPDIRGDGKFIVYVTSGQLKQVKI